MDGKEDGHSGSPNDSQPREDIQESHEGLPFESTIGRQTKAILIERARALTSRSKFYEAGTVLEEIEENDGMDFLGVQLLATEIYQQLGRENRANKCIKYIKEALTSQPTLAVDELIALGTDLIAESSYIRAMVVLKITVELIFNVVANPDEILSEVYRCYNKIDDVVAAMINQKGRNRTIAADYGIEIMLEIYKNICDIRGCSRNEQVLKEAWCCRYLCHKYSLLPNHQKCAELGYHVIKNMEEQFTESGAQRYRIYGITLHLLGVTLHNDDKFEESLAVHQKALEAKENALDFRSEIIKRKEIELTRNGLNIVRKALGQY